MKNRISLIGVAVGMVALMAAFAYSRAQSATPPAATATSKIGVVSIAGIFSKSQVQSQYRAKQNAADADNRAKLEALAAKIEADRKQLDTYKSSSDDYLKLVQAIIENRSKLDSQQEYLKQQRLVEDRRQLEKLYPEILKVVAAVAKEKGLDLVLERTEPSLGNARTTEELTMAVSSHKALYTGGCVDLTEEVVTRLDASVKPQN
jgi:Skp family chaperone for outer membrane proteins